MFSIAQRKTIRVINCTILFLTLTKKKLDVVRLNELKRMEWNGEVESGRIYSERAFVGISLSESTESNSSSACKAAAYKEKQP